MKKVLIITYYWPPSGGAGVQRWLKLSKYLAELGTEVHVLAPKAESASYMSIDNSLEKDIHPDVFVHRTHSFEVINYYSKLVGKRNVPTAGFSNVNNKSLKQKLVNSIRSNFFIPDPRIGWKKYAVKKAIELIQEYQIESIITTSPPHSTQIIGHSIQKKTGVKWIVDLRDPWTDIYYYKLLGHSFLSRAIDKKLEKKVLEDCDQIITVSYGFRSLFLDKSSKITEAKFEIIPNGFDPIDFNIDAPLEMEKEDNEFLICYTGTMSAQYNPFLIFDALNELIESKEFPSLKIRLSLVGMVATEIKEKLKDAKFNVEYIDTVPHSEINFYQKKADLLLLIIPNTALSNGITPGKLFEYLATKNQILALGPTHSDVNRIIQECRSGATFERSQKTEMLIFLKEKIKNKLQGKTELINEEALHSYSRMQQAKKIFKLI